MSGSDKFERLFDYRWTPGADSNKTHSKNAARRVLRPSVERRARNYSSARTTTSHAGQNSTQTTTTKNKSTGRFSQRPRNKHEVPSNPIRFAREHSVLKAVCP